MSRLKNAPGAFGGAALLAALPFSYVAYRHLQG
jgi:hypothetical protein